MEAELSKKRIYEPRSSITLADLDHITYSLSNMCIVATIFPTAQS